MDCGGWGGGVAGRRAPLHPPPAPPYDASLDAPYAAPPAPPARSGGGGDPAGGSWREEEVAAEAAEAEQARWREEAERRARRRHRRRVARIVADQWLWASRERLRSLPARQHRARALRARAWRGWAGLLRRRQLLGRAAAGHAAVRARAGARRCLAPWLAAARAAGGARARAEGLAAARERRALALALAVLWAHAAGAARERRTRQRADWHRRARLCWLRVRGFRAGVARAAAQRARAEAAIRHWAAGRCRGALARWRAAAGAARAVRERAARADLAQEASVLRRHAGLWRRAVEARRARRARGAELLRFIAEEEVEKLHLRLLECWRAKVLAKKSLTEKLGKAALMHMGHARKAGFRGWKAVWAKAKAAGKASKVLAMWQSKTLALAAFGAWAQDVERAQKRRGHERAIEVKRRAALALWRAAVAAAGAERRNHARAGKQFGDRVLRRCVRAWRSRAAERAEKDVKDRHARRFAYFHRLGRSFAAFHAGVQVQIHAERLVYVAATNRLQAVLWAAFGHWRTYLAHLRRKAKARAMGARKCLRTALRGWVAYSARKNVQELKRRKAVRYSYFKRIIAGMTAFLFAVERKHEKDALYGRVRAVFHVNLLGKTFREWAHEHVPAQRAKRDQLALAALQWRNFKLLRALRGWKRLVPELARANEAFRAAALHARMVGQWKAVEAWKAYARGKQDLREARELFVQDALEAARKSKRARVFGVWAEAYRAGCVEKVNTVRALTFERERRLRGSWSLWARWHVHRRAVRALEARASGHYSRKLQGKGWGRWAAYRAQKLVEREQFCAAVQHWAHTVTQKCLAWWRKYLELRALKDAEMDRALALYRTSLQKEGAVQWLKVGLWRHEVRVKERAEREAQRARDSVFKAERFARKWRRVTQEKSRTALPTAKCPPKAAVPAAAAAAAAKGPEFLAYIQERPEPLPVGAPAAPCTGPAPAPAGRAGPQVAKVAGAFDPESWKDLAGTASRSRRVPQNSYASSVHSFEGSQHTFVSDAPSLGRRNRPRPRRALDLLTPAAGRPFVQRGETPAGAKAGHGPDGAFGGGSGANRRPGAAQPAPFAAGFVGHAPAAAAGPPPPDQISERIRMLQAEMEALYRMQASQPAGHDPVFPGYG